MPSRPPVRNLKVVLPLAILTAGAAIFVILQATRPEVEAKPPVEQAWAVESVPVEIGVQRAQMRFEGEVVSGRQGELRPLVSGRIVELHPNFRDGGPLRAGETVVRIDPFAYEAAVAERAAELAEAGAKVRELEAELDSERKNLVRDQEQLTLARQDLERSEKLRKAGTIADRALETARIVASEREQRVLTRQQSIARFDARLEQSRAMVDRLESALERARRNLAETVLTAPFDGVLADTNAAIGQLAGTNDRLARIIDRLALEVRFHVPDTQFGRLLGAPLNELPTEVHWRVGEAVLSYPARIDRVDSQIKPASGGVLMYAKLEAQLADSRLRPGAFVTVEVTGPAREGLARLPMRSLFGGDTVYIIADGRLAARKVEAVARDGDTVLVRGDLHNGEHVVATRFPEIAPGVKVDIP